MALTSTLKITLTNILKEAGYPIDGSQGPVGVQQTCEGIALVDAMHELTLILPKTHVLAVLQILKEHPDLLFEQLIDVCGVDYLHYGCSQWATVSTTLTGFSRAVEPSLSDKNASEPNQLKRFAVVYHLLSLSLNHRLRVKVFVDDAASVRVASVVPLWPAANWFEREAFDLFGILFDGHPDLRRILTDYGFVGHPFRKDFPLSGDVEVRYDAAQERVIYEPVDIEPRVLVPKVIRKSTS